MSTAGGRRVSVLLSSLAWPEKRGFEVRDQVVQAARSMECRASPYTPRPNSRKPKRAEIGICTLRELVEAEDEEGLKDLVAEDGGLDAARTQRRQQSARAHTHSSTELECHRREGSEGAQLTAGEDGR
jgi:hypothetical protein